METTKLSVNLDKWGTAGLLLTALLSPCCFPLFAFVASALGLGSFELFGGWTMLIFQGMALLSLTGLYFSYRQHRCMYPLLIAVPAVLLIFYGSYFVNAGWWIYLLYVGILGLLIATGVNYYRHKLHGSCNTTIKRSSVLTCPHCGHIKEEEMPVDSCQYFYECENCKTVMKPKVGDCCVYCSYGTNKCPSKQGGDGECC